MITTAISKEVVRPIWQELSNPRNALETVPEDVTTPTRIATAVPRPADARLDFLDQTATLMSAPPPTAVNTDLVWPCTSGGIFPWTIPSASVRKAGVESIVTRIPAKNWVSNAPMVAPA